MLKEKIELKLQQALSPVRLEVVDESHKHIGHVGAKPGGETHFYVKVVSPKFNDMSRLERHRKVYEVLDNEIKEGVHALRLKLMSEEESTELE